VARTRRCGEDQGAAGTATASGSAAGTSSAPGGSHGRPAPGNVGDDAPGVGPFSSGVTELLGLDAVSRAGPPVLLRLCPPRPLVLLRLCTCQPWHLRRLRRPSSALHAVWQFPRATSSSRTILATFGLRRPIWGLRRWRRLLLRGLRLGRETMRGPSSWSRRSPASSFVYYCG
jgi:hypothetical protein